MIKYLVPLGIFAFGMIVALVLFLFLGSIGSAVDQMNTDTASITTSVFWNWDVVSSTTSVKFIVFLLVMLLTLFASGKAFLKLR